MNNVIYWTILGIKLLLQRVLVRKIKLLYFVVFIFMLTDEVCSYIFMNERSFTRYAFV